MSRHEEAARLRLWGHRLIDRIADNMAAAADPVVPPIRPADARARWSARMESARAGGQDPVILLEAALAESTRLHHPGFVAHQVAAPHPAAILGELVSAYLNNGMAIYDVGPAATGSEEAVVRWMADRLGMPASATGALTSGGSLGNLTALLAARQAMSGRDVWREGAHAGPPGCVLATRESHYCIERAVRILGLGDGGIEYVTTDAAHRLDPSDLGPALERARARRREPFAVIGVASSTATGAVDPLNPIADFAAEHDLWFHVDGAHGASFVLLPEMQEKLSGIARADSVVWDLHKMLRVPALVTGVLYRDGEAGYGAFAQDASYLYEADDEERADRGHLTLECTKRMMAIEMLALLAAEGEPRLQDYLRRTLRVARSLADRIEASEVLELALRPEANIVCYRARPAGVPPGPDLDALQVRLRQEIVATGAFYVVKTTLPGGVYLRSTLIHPDTSEAELDRLVGLLEERSVIARPR